MPLVTDDWTLLANATTALRDIYVGYSYEEVVSNSGETGGDFLLVELVKDLRGRGVDDDGGWDCFATEDIPVSLTEIALDPHNLIDDLSLATSALRDLREGWPHEEIGSAGHGRGLESLLSHLVTKLRAHGIDDDGGWDCDVTEDIPVAKVPAPR